MRPGCRGPGLSRPGVVSLQAGASQFLTRTALQSPFSELPAMIPKTITNSDMEAEAQREAKQFIFFNGFRGNFQSMN